MHSLHRTAICVKNAELQVLCEVAEERDLSEMVLSTTGIAVHDPSIVTDEQIAALFDAKDQLGLIVMK